MNENPSTIFSSEENEKQYREKRKRIVEFKTRFSKLTLILLSESLITPYL